MEYNPKDNDVIHLLKKLKDSNGIYPQEMMASRRQVYLKQVAEISGAAGLAMGLKNAVKSGSSTGSASAAGTLVEALLVVAIIAEAGAVAYFYRDKVVEFFQSISNSSQVQVVTEPPEAASPIPGLTITPTPVISVTATVMDTATPLGSPSVVVASESTEETEAEGRGSSNPTVSTPDPNNNDNDNNGNQYGLTPKPERTKEPGNDVSDENEDSHNDRQNGSGPRRNR